MAPTRELAFQIGEQFEALGSVIGVKCAVAVGGVDMVQQAIVLAKRLHVVVGTPGRIVDHLQNTRGFSIRTLKFLVLDEADKLLNMDFEKELDIILGACPKERNTYLFSATMTSKVKKLQRASLTDPVKVEVSEQVRHRQDVRAAVPLHARQAQGLLPRLRVQRARRPLDDHLRGDVRDRAAPRAAAARARLRRHPAARPALSGQAPRRAQQVQGGRAHRCSSPPMSPRAASTSRPSTWCSTLSCPPTRRTTSTASAAPRARDARAGAVSFVTQYDVEIYQRIEHMLGQKLEAFDAPQEEALLLMERVGEAQRYASMEMRSSGDKRKAGGKKRKGEGGGGDGDEGDHDLARMQQQAARSGGGGKKPRREKP